MSRTPPRSPRQPRTPEKANPERGEHEVSLGGVTYVLRPSYAAIRAIEDKSGKSIVDIAKEGHAGAMLLYDAQIVAGEMIRAGAGDDPFLANLSNEKIGELIFEAGLPHVAARLVVALVDAATGGRTASGEAKAVARTSPAPATAE